MEVIPPTEPQANAAPDVPQSDARALWFALNEESGELQAHFDPTGNTPPNSGGVKAAIAEAGYSNIHLDDAALAEFIHNTRSCKEILIWVIGKKRDAELSLTLSDDLMTATLTLIPAEGGAPATMVMINGLLREQGVCHGILHSEIDAALAEGTCEALVIARGDAPANGVEARFESLLEVKQHELSHIDETAIVKYRDLSHLLIVQPGDRLMVRIPPVQGSNGIDIKGQVAFAPPLPDLAFGNEFPGAAPDASNPNLLRATITGQPRVVEHGVTVNPVIEVEGVNLTTGSIKFEGTVHVNGDVIAGMRIEVTGDVIIRGTLEAAEIIAGGNVAVEGGIIGHADTRPGAHGLPPDTARIRCKGSVQAMFVENAHIEAGDSIMVERSVRQCELIALNDIIVGKAGSKISHIMGGTCQAKHLIKVMTLGSSTGMKTHVQVGSDPFVGEEIHKKEHLVQIKNSELDQMLKLLAFFKVNPKKGEGGIAEKVNAKRLQLMKEINDCNVELAQLAENAILDEEARIEVSKEVHYGVEVKIGKSNWHATDDMPGTIIGLQEGHIATGLTPIKKEKEPEDIPPSPPSRQRFG